MRDKRILVVGLLLLAAALYVLLQDSSTGDRAGRRPDEDGGGTGPELEGARPLQAPAPASAGTGRGAAAGEPDGRGAADPGRRPSASVRVRGRVIVERDGEERTPETGTIRLIAWKGPGGGVHDVAVRGGAFVCDVEPETEIVVRSLELDGRVATSTEPKRRWPADPGTEILVRARQVEATRLRVVSAVTELDLDGVEIVSGDALRGGRGLAHPGVLEGVERVVRGARSPVELPLPTETDVRRGFQRLYVRAAGHAWAAVQVDPAGGREQRVVLRPGGTVVVRLAPSEAWDGRFVRLVPEGKRWPVATVAIGASREIRIEGVAAGGYAVDVATGGGVFPEPKVLVAEASVEVVAERETTVSFDPPPVERDREVPFRGTLELSLAWGRLANPWVWVRSTRPDGTGASGARKVGLAPLPAGAADRQRFSWDAGPARPGTYLVECTEVHWRAGIQVPESGTTDASIVVPDPVAITLHLRMSDGGPLPRIAYVNWFPRTPSVRSGSTYQRAVLDAQLGGYTLVAPAGRIRLDLPDMTVEPETAEIEVGPGRTDYDVLLKRCSGFVIVLKDGDRTLVWFGPWFDRAESVDGGEEHTGWGMHERGKLVTVPKPGRYRVFLKEIPGYVHPGALTVDVAEGRFVDLVVPLVKAR